jgi:hypothetical protein
MKKIEEDKIQNRYGITVNMVKLMPSKHAEEELRGRLAPEAPSQVQAWVNKKLKREGAIVDINALCETQVNNAASESSKHGPQQNLMDENYRYILSPILMFLLPMLDPITLHYWMLSDANDNKQKCSSVIKTWASAVPNGTPTS